MSVDLFPLRKIQFNVMSKRNCNRSDNRISLCEKCLHWIQKKRVCRILLLVCKSVAFIYRSIRLDFHMKVHAKWLTLLIHIYVCCHYTIAYELALLNAIYSCVESPCLFEDIITETRSLKHFQSIRLNAQLLVVIGAPPLR